jgi:hypothetical protein
LRKRRHSLPSFFGHTAAKLLRANLRGSRRARRQNCARACASAERSTANPEVQPARNSVRTPRGRAVLLVSVRRGLLGFAGLAPHSGRSSVPFRLACSGTEDNTLPTQRFQNIRNRPTQVSNIPDKQRSIRKSTCGVKSQFSPPVEKSVRMFSLYRQFYTPYPCP